MSMHTITVDNGQVKIIDQTLLPTTSEYRVIHNKEEMWEAIKILRIRGAPAIGIAAAFGTYLGIKESQAADFNSFWNDVEVTTDYLATSRPTAVNLFWALDLMKVFIKKNYGSQKHYADYLDISPVALSRYISDIIKPGLDMLLKFQSSGLSVDWLLDEVGSMDLQDSSENNSLSITKRENQRKKKKKETF